MHWRNRSSNDSTNDVASIRWSSTSTTRYHSAEKMSEQPQTMAPDNGTSDGEQVESSDGTGE